MRGLSAVVLAVLVAAQISACATQRDWSAIGGSRADGTIKLSYQYNQFEQPVVYEDQAEDLATDRCRTWGYTGAEAFGGEVQQCMQQSGLGGCGRWMVTKEYQCTGTGTIAR